MRIQHGKKIEWLEPQAFAARVGPYDKVLLDIGAGDGAFAYRQARACADTFCIALDPAGENMAEFSGKALKKPARGGAENVIFVVESAENLPVCLAGLATLLTVNYPWGALLRAMIQPDVSMLRGLAAACKGDAKMVCLLNASIFQDAGYLERLVLPGLSLDDAHGRLAPAYGDADMRVEACRYLGGQDPPHRTTWGQRLVRGSQRETLLIEATVKPTTR